MSNHVPVLDTTKKRLGMVHPAQARIWLNKGLAAVFKRFPFTIILKQEVDIDAPEYQLKIDPGSKTTGFAILCQNKVVWAAELTHRGAQFRDALTSRRALRRGRRNRKTRYRKARFLNRRRPEGWLAPSLQHRVDTTLTWVKRLSRVIPITSIAQELVRFDMQKMQNPEVSGVEYQQGELYQFEVREYLLEKWKRECAYCGAKDTPLAVEHIIPRSKGGSNRVSNLTLACVPCNQAKGNLDIRDFLSGKPDLLTRILSKAKQPRSDAAAVNSTRWALFRALKDTGVPVTVGTGGQTKYNRHHQGLPKAHWLDATCVGETPQLVFGTTQPLLIKAVGHGSRQVIHGDKYGFPRRNAKGELVRKSAEVKEVRGFRSGDIVKAVVPSGKKVGIHTGKVSIRTSGSFNISTKNGTVQGINYKYCSLIQRKDGYNYAF